MIRDLRMSQASAEDDTPEEMCDGDPTPEQIDEETAKIREGWSEKTRQSRRVTKLVRYALTPVSVDEWAESVASTFRN